MNTTFTFSNQFAPNFREILHPILENFGQIFRLSSLNDWLMYI